MAAPPTESDFLARKSFGFRASDPDAVAERTVSDARAVFKRFDPAFDSSTKVIRPLRIGGSSSHPTMNVVVRKCVLFVCREVELDATISIRSVSGPCKRNYLLHADLSRSSDTLTESYDNLAVNICYQSERESAQLELEGFALRSREFSEGTVSREILKMLRMQVEPMTAALKKSLESNGARRVRSY